MAMLNLPTVPLKPLSEQLCGRYSRFPGLKVLNFDNSLVFSCNVNAQL